MFKLKNLLYFLLSFLRAFFYSKILFVKLRIQRERSGILICEIKFLDRIVSEQFSLSGYAR